MYTHTHTCIYICIYIYIYTYIYIYMCVCTPIFVFRHFVTGSGGPPCARSGRQRYICICLFIDIYIYMYIYITFIYIDVCVRQYYVRSFYLLQGAADLLAQDRGDNEALASFILYTLATEHR